MAGICRESSRNIDLESERLELPGLALVRLRMFRDERGFFVERYRSDFAKRGAEIGLPREFVQDNHSRSLPGVLRGLHFQHAPAQGKLIGVVRGRIWDVVVDIRPGSPTFGKSLGLELNGDSGLRLWGSAGFGHGVCVLGEEPADVLYKVDAAYEASGEGGIHWADPELAIDWPIAKPSVSARDERLGSFAEYRARPRFE